MILLCSNQTLLLKVKGLQVSRKKKVRQKTFPLWFTYYKSRIILNESTLLCSSSCLVVENGRRNSKQCLSTCLNLGAIYGPAVYPRSSIAMAQA